MKISCLCLRQSLNDKYILCVDVYVISILLGILRRPMMFEEILLMVDKDVQVVICFEIYSSITIAQIFSFNLLSLPFKYI